MIESGQEERESGNGAEAIEENLEAQLEQVRYTLGAWNQRALQLMREYPGASLLVAVGAGFLIGRLASRR